jgi:hypothetical protein
MGITDESQGRSILIRGPGARKQKRALLTKKKFKIQFISKATQYIAYIDVL